MNRSNKSTYLTYHRRLLSVLLLVLLVLNLVPRRENQIGSSAVDFSIEALHLEFRLKSVV